MKNGSVAIGVIGAGIMGERLLNAIRAQDRGLPHACGIGDPALAAMQRMERTFPDLPRLADAASVIAASDCVYIASPPASPARPGAPRRPTRLFRQAPLVFS